MNISLNKSFSVVFKNLQDSSIDNLSHLASVGSSSHFEQMKSIVRKYSPEEHTYRLMNEFFEMGPITDLIRQENVSEIIINGKDNIFYEQNGYLQMLKDSFLSNLTFSNFIHRICEESGVVLSLNQLFADGNWRGWRVHFSRKPVVNMEFHVSFRRHPKNPWTFELLKNQGWAPKSAIHFIQDLLKNRKNILIAGPTSSGKTSVLNSCLQVLPFNERVIIIEDSSELLLPNAFSTKLLTRTIQQDSLIPIRQDELVRQSLRMRPDRIVMGETRGTEAKDLLMALATGHSGSLGTIHAKDHKQALWRLEMLVQMGAPHWSNYTIQQMIVLSIDYLILLGRYQGERKLLGIYKLSGVENTGYLFETLFFHQLDSQFQKLVPVRSGRS